LISREGAAEAATVTGSEAWAIVNRMIAGILIYGGLGWFIGRFFDAATLGFTIGTFLGLGLAMYTTTVKIKALGEDSLKVAMDQPGTSWSRRMTQIRMSNARETSE
jgi:F0F1-type ATP synthase assembly protein I